MTLLKRFQELVPVPDNSQYSLLLQDVVLQWLMTDSIQLNQIDAEDPEVRRQPSLCYY